MTAKETIKKIAECYNRHCNGEQIGGKYPEDYLEAYSRQEIKAYKKQLVEEIEKEVEEYDELIVEHTKNYNEIGESGCLGIQEGLNKAIEIIKK